MKTSSKNPIHFFLGGAVVLAILIDLTSGAAVAGLPQRPEAETVLPVVMAPAEAAPARSAAPLALASGPYLEDDPEFAPKFKQVVGRARPQSHALDRLGCALNVTRMCVHART